MVNRYKPLYRIKFLHKWINSFYFFVEWIGIPLGIGVALTDAERADLTVGYHLQNVEASNVEDNDTQSLPLTGHADDDVENDDDGTDKVPKKRTTKANNKATKKKKGLGKGKYVSSIL